MLNSLKLFLVTPILHVVKINAHETISIQTNVIAEMVENCFVTLKYDSTYFDLVKGNELISLGSGSFSKQLSWVLKAMKISYNSLWTEITAEAGNLFQAVGFNIIVMKMGE